MERKYKYKCDRCDYTYVIDGTEETIYESMYYIPPHGCMGGDSYTHQFYGFMCQCGRKIEVMKEHIKKRFNKDSQKDNWTGGGRCTGNIDRFMRSEKEITKILDAISYLAQVNKMSERELADMMEDYSGQQIPEEVTNDFKLSGLMPTDLLTSSFLRKHGLKNALEHKREEDLMNDYMGLSKEDLAKCLWNKTKKRKHE